MGYKITASVYEIKANLSRYLRALARGDTDAVIIERYGKQIAMMVSFAKGPALPPQTQDDMDMRARAVFVDTGAPSRRGRPQKP